MHNPDDEDKDDLAAWQELLRSVKPLARSREVVSPTPPKINMRNIRQSQEIIPDMRSVTPSPLPQKQIKKLRTQRIEIELSLDLHGYRVDAAHMAVMRFMRNALHNHIRCVEIITGRGNAEQGTGELRRLVPEWLRDAEIRQAILHVEPNPATRGGSLLILLRRHKNK